jgi:hypothetical protein
MGEHLVYTHEGDLVTPAAGFVGERLGEMALAGAGRAEHEDALVARDELAGGEIEDLALLSLGLKLKSKPSRASWWDRTRHGGAASGQRSHAANRFHMLDWLLTPSRSMGGDAPVAPGTRAHIAPR